MGRVRGKAKKLTVSSHEDGGSGEEEKVPVQKRRGRPQKPFKEEIEVDHEDVAAKMEEEAVEDVKKRKRNSATKDKHCLVKEEDGVGATLATDITSKPNGFRHIGSRRKNKPRRAAEVGVEC